MCRRVVAGVRERLQRCPMLAKLTPNVTDIAAIARAAADGGADAISAVNTCLGMAVDWRRRKPPAGQRHGRPQRPGHQADRPALRLPGGPAVEIPVVGIGGIATLDDVMEFLVAGASAVQIGTANFYNPTATMEILDHLPAAVAELGASQRAPKSSARSN